MEARDLENGKGVRVLHLQEGFELLKRIGPGTSVTFSTPRGLPERYQTPGACISSAWDLTLLSPIHQIVSSIRRSSNPHLWPRRWLDS